MTGRRGGRDARPTLQRAGAALLALIAVAALAAPVLAPHEPGEVFRDHAFAPPMPPRVVDAEGRWRGPFVYPVRLVNRLEQRYEEDRSRPLPLAFFSRGRLVRLPDESQGPWLPLGGDGSGRDLLTRLLFGARTSLGVAAVAALGAILIGLVLGGVAGYAGGGVDETLMRFSEFVLVMTAVFVVLALRSALPLLRPPATVFLLMSAIFALVGWPWVARAVRGVIASERTRDYSVAALSLGATHTRLLVVHLLPACRRLLAAQAVLLVPAFVLAEATLSYLGLGFPDTTASWGSMLQDASDPNVLLRCPWTLAPAGGIALVTLAVNLFLEAEPRPPR
ncbi:MAG: ABC transporter permease [Acidobacteria bacterium]|nr:MAG: ABC transporter permease [Acidobacteriota bacterium]